MVQVRMDSVIRAAEALRLAGQWDMASELLSAVSTADTWERAELAVALAETMIDRGFWRSEPVAPDVVEDATATLGPATDGRLRWELDLLRLRLVYQSALARLRSGAGVDAAEAGRLDEWAERLRATANGRRAGWAAFWGGVIADNLCRIPEAAFERYNAAFRLAEETGDELLASYALRHLGDHAYEQGDLASARDMWETSTRLREKAGFVPGALAQRLLMGELLLAEGDRAGAAALAADVQRAAEAIGVTWLANAAAGLIDRSKANA